MQMSSWVSGSTAEIRVVRVVRARLEPHGTVVEKANSPGPTGQKPSSSPACRVGSGDAGRKVSQREEKLLQALRVRIEVVVKSVAGTT